MLMESIDAKNPPRYDEATPPPHQAWSDTRVRLNVGGQKFSTWSSTLAKLAMDSSLYADLTGPGL